jgi:hypothetical protein
VRWVRWVRCVRCVPWVRWVRWVVGAVRAVRARRVGGVHAPATHAVLEDLGLFEDLLEHKVLVRALLDLVQRELELLDLPYTASVARVARVAGEQLAGEQLAGEQLAGEQLAGEQLAGVRCVVWFVGVSRISGVCRAAALGERVK